MTCSPDCLILGGGIAGLWTLRALLADGLDAVLIETDALGAGQTIASQGILHAGTKYALSGHAAEASRAAAEAAAVWRACLGDASGPAPPPASGPAPNDPDLARTAVLCPHTSMFTTPGVASRLSGLAAAKALASGPQKLPRAEFPEAFADAPAAIDVYQLPEPVLDPRTLIATLADPARDRLIHARAVSLAWSGGSTRGVVATVETDGGSLAIEPRALVCTAGAGNGRLLEQLGLSSAIRMQRRPLHMVLARARSLPHLYAHCVTLSDKPRATITSAVDAAGRTVWYIGGQIAESGVDRSRDDQVAAARTELTKILPWIDTSGLEFATHRVDRAEGFDVQGRRPDTPVVRREGAVIACWPTKLVLAPLAARAIREELTHLAIAPSATRSELLSVACRPPTATPLWDREDLAWS